MSGPRRALGFTLLELLVSLVLFALLAAALQQTIAIASRAARASAAGAAEGERQRVLADFVQRHLAQALPVVLVERGRPRLLFEGDSNRLAFVTLLPPLAGFSGPSEVVLETPDGPRGMLEILYRALDPRRAEEFGRGEYRSRALGVELDELRFAYYGAPDRQQSPGWHDRWRDEQRLPESVRVTLRPRGGEAWPEVIVMLRIDRSSVLRQRLGTDLFGPSAIGGLESVE